MPVTVAGRRLYLPCVAKKAHGPTEAVLHYIDAMQLLFALRLLHSFPTAPRPSRKTEGKGIHNAVHAVFTLQSIAHLKRVSER